MQVSFYNNIKDATSQETADIIGIINDIKGGKWQDLCLPITIEIDKKKRNKLKEKVPNFTPSGTFTTRNKSNIIEHSGLIAIDFDEVDNINLYINIINNDQYTFASFKSVSHKGFCVLVKINSAKHLESFNGLAEYYYNLLRIPIDQSGKDISRTRFVSFDPNAFLNEKSKIFKEYPKIETKKQWYERTKIDYLHTNDRFDDVLKQIINTKTDITGNYNQWVLIGFSIASKYGDAGVDYFNTVSQFSAKYDTTICDKQYKYCCRNKQGITISTFYYYAKINGINISSKEQDEAAKVIHFAAKSGKTKEQIKELVGDKVSDATITAVVDSDNFTPVNSNEKLNINDVELFIQTNYKIKKNEITRFYELDGDELETEDLNSIYITCKKTFEKLSRDIFDSIIFSRFTKTYNPIKAYFNSLEWDGTERITTLCESINSITGTFDYRLILLRSWLIGIVESVMIEEPNILQLILAGKQNTGKSAFFKKLLPKELKKYFALSQLDKGKDDELLMCQKLLILDDEYSGKSKQDAKLIKRLLSAPSFDLREPYGKKNITCNRIATLAATSNETELLNDSTGNRRNIVFEVDGKFNYSQYNSIDKEQLFAEVMHLHKEGYSSQLTDAMIDLINEYTGAKNSETSIEAECIIMQYEEPKFATSYDFYTATEIKDLIETRTKQKLSAKKLGMELRRLGYQRVQRKWAGYGYLIKQKSFQ